MALELIKRKEAEPLSQGDIIRNIPVAAFSSLGEYSPQNILGVILSHSCELDKPKNLVALVCELRKVEGLQEQQAEQIRQGKVLNAAHVGEVESFGEAFVDFRQTHRVFKPHLLTLIPGGRVSALAEKACVQLSVFFFRYLVRELPPETEVVS